MHFIKRAEKKYKKGKKKVLKKGRFRTQVIMKAFSLILRCHVDDRRREVTIERKKKQKNIFKQLKWKIIWITKDLNNASFYTISPLKRSSGTDVLIGNYCAVMGKFLGFVTTRLSTERDEVPEGM